MASREEEMILALRAEAGGLNWLDELPAQNEYKALYAYEYENGVLSPPGGYDVLGTDSSTPVLAGVGRYRTILDTTNREYAVFLNSGKPYSMLLHGGGSGVAATGEFNELLYLSSTSVNVACTSNQIPDEVTSIQVENKVLMFVGGGKLTGSDYKNLVLEYDSSKSGDFVVRDMGISAPTIRPTVVVQGSGNLTAKWRYYWTWVRKDANGLVLSESGANTATAYATNFSEVDFEDKSSINISLVGVGACTSDAQVTHARLYRSRNLNDPDYDPSTFYHLTDIAATAVTGGYVAESDYDDNKSDDELYRDAGLTVLLGEFDIPLPACRHAVYSGFRTWASDGDKVYFSYPPSISAGVETYDQRTNYLTTTEDGGQVRHLFKYDGHVVVVKDEKTGVILSSDPANAIRWTDPGIGSIHKNSFVTTPFGVIGLTSSGVRVHNGMQWSDQVISAKVIKHNEFDVSQRVMPQNQLGAQKPLTRAFWYNGRYYLRIDGIDTGNGKQNAGLVYQPGFGWSETDQDWVYAIPYADDSRICAMNNSRTEAAVRLFVADNNNGTDITGVIQPGYVQAPVGAYEIADITMQAKLSSAASIMVKTTDGIHVVATNVVPTPIQGMMNRKFRGNMAGYKKGDFLAAKFKTVVKRGDFVKEFKLKLKQIEDYGYKAIQAAGMFARYTCDHLTGTTVLPDVTGNGMDLTFSYSTAALVTTDSFAARLYGIQVSNTNDDVCGFKNTEGYKISPSGDWSIALKARIPSEAGSAYRIFENGVLGESVALDLDTDTGDMKMTVGTTAIAWASAVSPGVASNIILTYRYKTGSYDTAGFNFKTDLYIDGTAVASTSDTAAALSASGAQWLMDSRNNYTVVDEIRVYGWQLTPEEVRGLNDEFYSQDDSDPQYY